MIYVKNQDLSNIIKIDNFPDDIDNIPTIE